MSRRVPYPLRKVNFYPRNPRAKSSSHNCGCLQAKRMVQKRLFRKSHPDEHYCAALFTEFAVKYRDLTNFICIDDKHRVKVREPGFPVAAAKEVEKSLFHSMKPLQLVITILLASLSFPVLCCTSTYQTPSKDLGILVRF